MSCKLLIWSSARWREVISEGLKWLFNVLIESITVINETIPFLKMAYYHQVNTVKSTDFLKYTIFTVFWNILKQWEKTSSLNNWRQLFLSIVFICVSFNKIATKGGIITSKANPQLYLHSWIIFILTELGKIFLSSCLELS